MFGSIGSTIGSTTRVGEKPHGRSWIDRLALKLFPPKKDHWELQNAVRKAEEDHRYLTNVFGDCGC